MNFSLLRTSGLMALIIAGTLPGFGQDKPAFSPRLAERQLFLDDAGVATIENLKLTMHRPIKRGAIIRSPNPKLTPQIRTAPVWNPETRRYMLWTTEAEYPLWESADGLNWQLSQVPDIRIDMAVYDLRDPLSARRFKAPILNGGFATSPDGVHWTKLDLPAVPSSDEGNFSYDSAEGLFIHTIKRGGAHGRSVAVATSRDFQTWNDLGIVFEADDQDQELGRQNIESRFADPTLERPRYQNADAYNVDVYNMGVFRYEGLYVGLPAMYHATGKIPNYPNTDGFHLVQLTSSRDLKTWKRLGERQPFVGPSRVDSGAYDLTQIISPSAPVIRDDELWFYYTGLKYRSTWDYEGTYPNGKTIPLPGKDRDIGGICLAVLRRDGFISLDAGTEGGSVTTRPFVLPSRRLLLNADAIDGEVQVQIEEQAGPKRVRSAVFLGDSPNRELVWEQGDAGELVGRSVALRFTLRNARLYSYWFDKDMPAAP